MATAVVLEHPGTYDAKKQPPDYDGLWKKLIEDLFNEFVLFFAPDLHEELDLTKRPEFLKQEIHKRIMKEKKGKLITDQIVKVFLKSGEEKWILIHIEIQGKPDKYFNKRMFQYFYRIYDSYEREIYAIALITDQSHREHVDGFHYSYYGTKVDYEYNVYTFNPEKIRELEQSNNPFAAAVIAGIYANQAKKDAEKRYKFKRNLMIQVLKKYTQHPENARTYLSALFYFIDYLLKIPDNYTKQLTEDIIPYFGKEVQQQMQAEKTNASQTLEEIFAELRQEGKEEGLEKGLEKGMEKGMEKGIEKGRKEALSSFIQELVNENFTNEQIAKITKLTLNEVIEWRKTL